MQRDSCKRSLENLLHDLQKNYMGLLMGEGFKYSVGSGHDQSAEEIESAKWGITRS
jgi:hypothetical protein